MGSGSRAMPLAKNARLRRIHNMTIRELKKLLKTLKKANITINGESLRVNIQVNQDNEVTLDFTTSRERRPQAGANEDKQKKEE